MRWYHYQYFIICDPESLWVILCLTKTWFSMLFLFLNGFIQTEHWNRLTSIWSAAWNIIWHWKWYALLHILQRYKGAQWVIILCLYHAVTAPKNLQYPWSLRHRTSSWSPRFLPVLLNPFAIFLASFATASSSAVGASINSSTLCLVVGFSGSGCMVNSGSLSLVFDSVHHQIPVMGVILVHHQIVVMGVLQFCPWFYE